MSELGSSDIFVAGWHARPFMQSTELSDCRPYDQPTLAISYFTLTLPTKKKEAGIFVPVAALPRQRNPHEWWLQGGRSMRTIIGGITEHR